MPPPAADAAAADAERELTKEDLEVFYTEHDPSKVSSVAKILKHYSTADLVASLTKKYGVSPFGMAGQRDPPAPVAQSAAAVESAAQRQKRTLVAFYQEHNPEKVKDVDGILANYKLEDTMRSLKDRYGTVPEGWGDPAGSSGGESLADLHKRALQQFYQKHNPEKAKDVDAILANYKIEDTARSLKDRYGELPEGWEAFVAVADTPKKSWWGAVASAVKKEEPPAAKKEGAAAPDALAKRKADLAERRAALESKKSPTPGVPGAAALAAAAGEAPEELQANPAAKAAALMAKMQASAMQLKIEEKIRIAEQKALEDEHQAGGGAAAANPAAQAAAATAAQAEPAAQAADASVEDQATLTREQLVGYYTKHDPSKIQAVDKILSHYSTADLVLSLTKKYKESPFGFSAAGPSTPVRRPSLGAAAAGGEGGAAAEAQNSSTPVAVPKAVPADSKLRERESPATQLQIRRRQLLQFYQKHNPEKAKDVDAILANYKIEDTTRSLRDRYGEVPEGWDVKPAGAAAPSTPNDEIRRRKQELADRKTALAQKKRQQEKEEIARRTQLKLKEMEEKKRLAEVEEQGGAEEAERRKVEQEQLELQQKQEGDAAEAKAKRATKAAELMAQMKAKREATKAEQQAKEDEHAAALAALQQAKEEKEAEQARELEELKEAKEAEHEEALAVLKKTKEDEHAETLAALQRAREDTEAEQASALEALEQTREAKEAEHAEAVEAIAALQKEKQEVQAVAGEAVQALRKEKQDQQQLREQDQAEEERRLQQDQLEQQAAEQQRLAQQERERQEAEAEPDPDAFDDWYTQCFEQEHAASPSPEKRGGNGGLLREALADGKDAAGGSPLRRGMSFGSSVPELDPAGFGLEQEAEADELDVNAAVDSNAQAREQLLQDALEKQMIKVCLALWRTRQWTLDWTGRTWQRTRTRTSLPKSSRCNLSTPTKH